MVKFENLQFYKTREEAEKDCVEFECNVEVLNFYDRDELTLIDNLFVKPSSLNQRFTIKFFISKDYCGLDNIGVYNVERIYKSNKKLYSYRLTLSEDEESNWNYSFYFNLKKSRNDIKIIYLEPSHKMDLIISKTEYGFDFTLYFKCSYEILRENDLDLISTNRIEVVTLRKFKYYFIYGKPLIYLANGFKCDAGDIVNVDGKFGDDELAVVKENHFIDIDTLDFDYSKIKSVVNISERKSESDHSLIELIKQIPQNYNFENGAYICFNNQIVNLRGLYNSLIDNNITVIKAKRGYGTKEYLIGSNEYNLIENDEVVVEDKEIATYHSLVEEVMFCDVWMHVTQGNYLLSIVDLLFPLSRLSYVTDFETKSWIQVRI